MLIWFSSNYLLETTLLLLLLLLFTTAFRFSFLTLFSEIFRGLLGGLLIEILWCEPFL